VSSEASSPVSTPGPIGSGSSSPFPANEDQTDDEVLNRNKRLKRKRFVQCFDGETLAATPSYVNNSNLCMIDESFDESSSPNGTTAQDVTDDAHAIGQGAINAKSQEHESVEQNAEETGTEHNPGTDYANETDMDGGAVNNGADMSHAEIENK
jgi:hypothetical protein